MRSKEITRNRKETDPSPPPLPSVILAVVDSFTNTAVLSIINNWINQGWLKTIFIDEAQEIACQFQLRQAAFERLSEWAVSPFGRNVFWVLMSGSLVPKIKSFVAGFLGFSEEDVTTKWKRIGREEEGHRKP